MGIVLSKELKDSLQELRAIPEGERVIVGGGLNGYVAIRREAIERIHSGWGVGEKNEERERVTDFAMAIDLSIVNTFSRIYQTIFDSCTMGT